MISFDKFASEVEAMLEQDDHGYVEKIALKETLDRPPWTPRMRRARLWIVHETIKICLGKEAAPNALAWFRQFIPAVEKLLVDLTDQSATRIAGTEHRFLISGIMEIGAVARRKIPHEPGDGPLAPALFLGATEEDLHWGIAQLKCELNWIENGKGRKRVRLPRTDEERAQANEQKRAVAQDLNNVRRGRALQVLCWLQKHPSVEYWEGQPFPSHNPSRRAWQEHAVFQVASLIREEVESDRRALHAARSLLWLATGDTDFAPSNEDYSHKYMSRLARGENGDTSGGLLRRGAEHRRNLGVIVMFASGGVINDFRSMPCKTCNCIFSEKAV